MAQRATWHIERRETGSPSTSPSTSPAFKRPPVPSSRADSADSVSQGVTRGFLEGDSDEDGQGL